MGSSQYENRFNQLIEQRYYLVCSAKSCVAHFNHHHKARQKLQSFSSQTVVVITYLLWLVTLGMIVSLVAYEIQ
jgi:hypothetical protein